MINTHELGREQAVLKPDFRLLSAKTDGHQGFGYGFMVFVSSLGVPLLVALTMAHASDSNPELTAYIWPACIFTFVSIATGGCLLRSSVRDVVCQPITLYENGFTYRKHLVLYRDVERVKFGHGEMVSLNQDGDCFKRLTLGGKLQLASEQMERMEQNRRAATIYIGTRNGQIVELESVLGTFPQEEIVKLIDKLESVSGSEADEWMADDLEPVACCS